MGASGWLIRRGLRRRWAGLVLLTLVVAGGTTGTLVALGAAQRTDTAYADYRQRAGVADFVINPVLNTRQIRDVIVDLPYIESMTSDGLLTASFDVEPGPLTAENAVEPLAVRGSTDGRYLEADRPAVRDGRLPTGSSELFVSEDLADAEGFVVGDRVPLGLYDPIETSFSPLGTIISPIGVEDVTIVGIGTMPDEVLPEPLYPRATGIVSPDIAERYSCLPDQPPSDATFDEAVEVLGPPGCSISYAFYALQLEGGDRHLAEVQDAFNRAADELNPLLPAALGETDTRYLIIGTTAADVQEQVDNSTRPIVAALSVLGIFAGVVTLLLAGLAVARELRRLDGDQREWWRLGMSAPQRAGVALAPLLGATVVGVAVGVALAWLISPIAPVGTVRSIDPHPGRALTSWVVIGASVLVAASLAIAAIQGWAWTRRVLPGRARPPRPSRLLAAARRTGAPPDVAEGVRAAFGTRRGSGVVVASGALAAIVFVAAVVFGSSLTALVSTPSSYGWPWDSASMAGYGYGPVDQRAVLETLEARDDVEGFTMLGFQTAAVVDDEAVFGIITYDASTTGLTMSEGELPEGAGEVALGRRTARALGVGVGDRVEVSGDGLPAVSARVSGIVVLPALGPFQSGRTGPGSGVVLPAAMFEDGVADVLTSFVGLEPRPGAGAGDALAALRDVMVVPERNDLVPLEYTAPVRPAEIEDAESMQDLPLVVGGVLVGTAVLGLSVAVAMSVRTRRRELATMRALGLTGGQVRRSVGVQVVTTVIAALAVGLPLGVAVGRLAWRAFAVELGVATEPSVPLGWLVVTIVGALGVAVLAAAVPARVAARTHPADALRAE